MNTNDLAVCMMSVPIVTLKWFTFSQNNSGGRFDRDAFVNSTVIIQAGSADEANELAQRIGIYFNGVSTGRDCSCCGSRWSRQSHDDDGTNEPQIYGQSVWPWSPDAIMESNNTIVYPYKIISMM